MNWTPYGNDEDPKPQQRNIPAMVWIMVLLAAFCVGMMFLTGCQHPQKRADGPNLAAAVKRSQDITETISLAESDSKEIKRAIMSMQESGKILHGLNGRAVLILDRNDYKIRKLLGK